ncbi:MAG: TetR/AcrR family transcriptional regulator [Kiritimatiellae bacterium]|nr:TetR/AcrR family transcriptional regulator [Kiritimatiellia bacterium]MDD3545652.1 TetR/AcrR family transcriptional regulator [Kiritimatiellia bacterium]MDD4025528.1 TetR/AcrR family transcriptional regulator [Kiritimatiellia bacterium]
MKSGKPFRRLPADKRRAVTVQTVIGLAAEQNPSEITTTVMAERMHMTQGALFRHFPTKDSIWQEVTEWVSECILTRVDAAMLDAKSPAAALEAIFMAHIDFVIEHPGAPRILFGELQRSDDCPVKRTVRTLLSHYSARLQSLIEQGKKLGELAPEQDAAASASLFIGMIQGLVMQSLMDGNSGSVRAKAAGVFAIFLRGIRRTK